MIIRKKSPYLRVSARAWLSCRPKSPELFDSSKTNKTGGFGMGRCFTKSMIFKIMAPIIVAAACDEITSPRSTIRIPLDCKKAPTSMGVPEQRKAKAGEPKVSDSNRVADPTSARKVRGFMVRICSNFHWMFSSVQPSTNCSNVRVPGMSAKGNALNGSETRCESHKSKLLFTHSSRKGDGEGVTSPRERWSTSLNS